jgi:hypothetical protein
MKDLILLVSPLPVCRKLIEDPLFKSHKHNFRIVVIDDEYTRQWLSKADVTTVPRLYIGTDDGYLKVQGYTDIVNFIKDTLAAPVTEEPTGRFTQSVTPPERFRPFTNFAPGNPGMKQVKDMNVRDNVSRDAPRPTDYVSRDTWTDFKPAADNTGPWSGDKSSFEVPA